MCPEAGGQNYEGENYGGQNYEEELRGQNCKSPICIAGDSAAGVASTLSAGHFLALLPRVFTDS